MSTIDIPLPNARKITLITGDITLERVEAIVNAANQHLTRGGGVCGAIHRAGGPAIWEECKAIIEKRGPVSTGHSVATTGGKLPARYVIHTVGPVWHGGNNGEPEQLASCYRESIRIADELELTTIACPSVSTGIFGYPVELASPVALNAVAAAATTAEHIREVRFVLFDEETFNSYAEAAKLISGDVGPRSPSRTKHTTPH